MDIISPYKLILGSGSPRRQQLLTEAKIPFTLRLIPVEESYPSEMPVEEIAEFLAVKKAFPHQELIGNDEIVITADSIVVRNQKVLGKPVDKKESIKMLENLSGKQHHVYTGVCFTTKHKTLSLTVLTQVKFLPLTRKEIEFYIDQYQPFDKAGAYGIQDWIGHTKIEWIKGSYSNVMGLPVHKVYQELIKIRNERVGF
ncbi:MAG TPA: Maf family nucleotide pyrophosphatase [Saprospiraceae bacterium]|nr:Maf family nucleotide pyrophosphatase [Saprospiraceae bacterium]